MAMGTRKQRERQEALWYRSELPEAPGHPFYRRLNDVLEREGFDRFCEARCREFYHERLGRPSLAPGIYFRLMMIGFFEGIDSERGIAWRLAEVEGVEAKDAAAVRRMDRKRRKQMRNEEWVNPNDPEAEITRLKDGRTALAYKAEQAVDMQTGAIVAVTTHAGATGDTESIGETVAAAGEAVAEQMGE